MPELPEVETVRRGLVPTFVGGLVARVEARRPDLRFPLPERFVERLEGRRVLDLRRRAKYLLADLDSGETLVMHLGMSGSFRVELPEVTQRPAVTSPLVGEGKGGGAVQLGRGFAEGAALAAAPHPDPPPQGGRGREAYVVGEFLHPRGKAPTHDHVVFHFEAGARVVYNDPRRFGFMQIAPTASLDRHPPFAALGVEPLSDAFDAAALAGVLAGARTPLKSALLDQRRIAGLGNIYVSEAMHRARLSPLREAGGLKPAETRRLANAIREVLEAAIEAGGSTLRDHRQADGTSGYFQHRFAVYDREGAVCGHIRCGGIVARIAQGGRSTFYCAVCQR